MTIWDVHQLTYLIEMLPRPLIARIQCHKDYHTWGASEKIKKIELFIKNLTKFEKTLYGLEKNK